MYRSSPSVVIEMRRAPAANSSSGTAVSGPRRSAAGWSTAPPGSSPARAPPQRGATSAGAASSSVSERQPFERAQHRDLAQQPVGAEAAASTSAIHGSWPGLRGQPQHAQRRQRQGPTAAGAVVMQHL